MIRFILLLCSVMFSVTLVAQKNTQAYDIKTSEFKVKKVIETFFEALHKGDSTLMKSTLHKEVKIQTTSTDKKGLRILKTEPAATLLSSVANKKPENIYFEKLLSYNIKVDGNLASVWTPYEFYVNGNFSHCGANSFQLFYNNNEWEIIFLVDMRRRDSCNALKEKN
ncbi:nuclear transport factor 2 family protein [Polaribacter sp. Hel_I_88]|uniref:nuclear transport factor 2 family protein n=1 Tax=Polaribacter sp. Hel_I_88 TaxID=1250006 RepID=UPI000564E8FC|nr:nuclear transport factor 2 family protein [Polaribacter sp. Hel_I_88]